MKTLLLVSLLCMIGCTREHDEAKLGPAPYDKPPTNKVSDVITSYVEALNARDSIGYWRLHLWEAYEVDESRRQVKTIWDSTKRTRIQIRLLHLTTFPFHVHSPDEHALFANAIVAFMDSARSKVDTLRAILRVDSGLWRMGQISGDLNKPYRLEPMNY